MTHEKTSMRGLVFGALLTGALTVTTAHSADIKTIEPGKLTIGINGDMPMTSSRTGS